MTSELRLGSIVAHGVGGPETGAINLIYAHLLNEYDQGFYSRIGINQIGEDLSEVVMREASKGIYVSIRYPTDPGFEEMNVDEKNRMRLDVIHAALLRIADYDGKFDIKKLEDIRNAIIEKSFNFEFIKKSVLNKKSGKTAKIVLVPQMDVFEFYLVVEDAGLEVCRVCFYRGLRDLIYFTRLFSIGKWNGEEEFIITGKQKEAEIHVFLKECRFEIRNLTPFSKPPFFEKMRGDISRAEKEQADLDFRYSLPPAVAAAIRKADN